MLALPVKSAVIIPAAKSPEPSRVTIVLGSLLAAASVASVISLVLFVTVKCAPAAIVFKLSVLLVLLRKI